MLNLKSKLPKNEFSKPAKRKSYKCLWIQLMLVLIQSKDRMTNIKFKTAAMELKLERCARGGFSTLCNALVCTKSSEANKSRY